MRAQGWEYSRGGCDGCVHTQVAYIAGCGVRGEGRGRG